MAVLLYDAYEYRISYQYILEAKLGEYVRLLSMYLLSSDAHDAGTHRRSGIQVVGAGDC